MLKVSFWVGVASMAMAIKCLMTNAVPYLSDAYSYVQPLQAPLIWPWVFAFLFGVSLTSFAKSIREVCD